VNDDGVGDEAAFALWEEEKTGGGPKVVTTQRLRFSSNWDGQETQQQAIARGNLMVHAR
jgi:hypothetical protein